MSLKHFKCISTMSYVWEYDLRILKDNNKLFRGSLKLSNFTEQLQNELSNKTFC